MESISNPNVLKSLLALLLSLFYISLKYEFKQTRKLIIHKKKNDHYLLFFILIMYFMSHPSILGSVSLYRSQNLSSGNYKFFKILFSSDGILILLENLQMPREHVITLYL